MSNTFLRTIVSDVTDILTTPLKDMAGDTGQSDSMIKATLAMSHIASESDVNWETFVESLSAQDKETLLTYANSK